MEKEKFIDQHSASWQQLDSLSQTINKQGAKNLSSSEVKEFLQLFRQSSRHLAYARTHYPNSELVSYLNSLIGSCHSQVYAVEKTTSIGFFNYMLYHLPKLLHQYKYYIIASFSFFSLGVLISLLFVANNPEQANLFLSERFIDAVGSNETGSGEIDYALMSSQVMINNISVALRSFVFGITLGLGTIYILFINGALLGALTALVYINGSPLQYWSLILPHGIIELTAIFISGAAGLLIAKHLLLPGDYSRKGSLIIGAKKAASLIIGVVIMLVIAGLIEGFFTPQNISAEIKLLFAALSGVLVILYFLLPYLQKSN